LQRPGEERQLYKPGWAWQKKIVFPFVVAARKKSHFFLTEKLSISKREEMKTIPTIRVEALRARRAALKPG
jgi:hypothetical protein